MSFVPGSIANIVWLLQNETINYYFLFCFVFYEFPLQISTMCTRDHGPSVRHEKGFESSKPKQRVK